MNLLYSHVPNLKSYFSFGFRLDARAIFVCKEKSIYFFFVWLFFFLFFCRAVLNGIWLSADAGLNYFVHLSIAFIFMPGCAQGNSLEGRRWALWNKEIGRNLEVLISCHRRTSLPMFCSSPLLLFLLLLPTTSFLLHPRDPEWGSLRWPE